MFEKIFGGNLINAYKTIRGEGIREQQRKYLGGARINPVETDYGTATTDTELNDYIALMQEVERKNREMEGRPQVRPLPAELGVGFGEPAPGVERQVQGIADQYTLPEVPQTQQQPQQSWFETYEIPQIEGRQPVQEIVVPDDVINTFADNAAKWAGTVSADPRLTYRQPDTVKENAEYVRKYVEALMRLAPYFDLPPKTMASMAMQESGYGGQRFEGNLSGYGFLDSGEDMGIRFDAPTVEEQAAKYLEKVATDWNGRYQGSRSPQDFHEKGYNPHADYSDKVMGVYRMLEAGL